MCRHGHRKLIRLILTSTPYGSYHLQMRHREGSNFPRSFCCCLVEKSCPTLLQPHGLGACQAPLAMGFPRKEYWSGLSFPTSGDLPDPGIEPASPALAERFFTTEQPGKRYWVIQVGFKSLDWLPSLCSSSFRLCFSPGQRRCYSELMYKKPLEQCQAQKYPRSVSIIMAQRACGGTLSLISSSASI